MTATGFELITDLVTSSAPEVISLISGKKWSRDSATANATAAESATTIKFHLTEPATGEFTLAFPTNDAHQCAAFLLGIETSSEPMLSADEIEALEECARQLVGGAMDGLRNELGRAKAEFVSSGDQPLDSSLESVISIACDFSRIRFALRMTNELSDALAGLIQANRATNSQPAEASVSGKSPASLTPVPPNLDLLMDVELPVKLRFGRREMPLREILELSSGSLIELDRQVNEPVELLLKERVIARGEVVIVDGNYGLRVTEVATPAESAVRLG